MPSELECRRPDFGSGIPIRLADGHEWHVPSIVARVGSRVEPEGARTYIIEWHVVGHGTDPNAAVPMIEALRF